MKKQTTILIGGRFNGQIVEFDPEWEYIMAPLPPYEQYFRQQIDGQIRYVYEPKK